MACACTGLYNLINTIFLGQALGSAGIAATTVGFPLQTVMFAFAMWFGAGGNARAAIKMGEGRPDEAERCLGNTILLNIVVDGVLTIVMLAALDPLLYLCGADASSIQMSRDYMGVMVVGFIIQAIGPSLNNFIRTDGSPTFALFTMIVGCSVSIFCNWLFVIVLGMGAFGGGLGTVCGQLGACIAVLGYFRTKRSLMKLRLSALRPDARIIKDIVALGLSSFFLQIAAALVSTLLNNQCMALGATDPIGGNGALAVIGTINKVVQMCGFVIFGISIAVQPIIGFNYGARIYRRVRRALWVAVGVSTVLAVIIWVVIRVLSGQILNLFGLEENLHDFGSRALGLFMMFYFLQPMQVIGSVFFQSTRQPVKATILSLTRQVIIYLPALYIVPAVLPAIDPSISPLLALTCVQPTSDLLSSLIVIGFQAIENRRLARLIEGQRDGTVPPPLELVAGQDGERGSVSTTA
ncbi:MAG: MATE family efflux transporter [Coriobacteriia bacterium]|nr:MATE family efflux transporter [Coriobacteriia bacterium]MBS5478020.1 MATE family efflux transporter [Coriobacteriia bacterium]